MLLLPSFIWIWPRVSTCRTPAKRRKEHAILSSTTSYIYCLLYLVPPNPKHPAERMATLFSLHPSSSILISPTRRRTLKHLSHLRSITTIPTHYSNKSLSLNSLLSPESGPPPPAVQTFWQWLSDEKVVSPKSPAKPGVVAEGLGLVAQRNIARNEVLLEIPKKFWINPDTVSASEIGSVCGGLRPWVSVALFLIREKLREDSPWRNYIDILPEYTDSTIFWWVWLSFLFYFSVFLKIVKLKGFVVNEVLFDALPLQVRRGAI